MTTVLDALAPIRDLGTPEQLEAQARAGLKPAVRPRSNSHIHLPPNFSAFESVRQAVELTAAQGVGVVGLSNYYDYDVYHEFAALARQHRIFPLFGLEIICLLDDLVRAGVKINDPGNPGKMYICGKGITGFAPMNAEARELIDLIRHNDSTRMAKLVARLNTVFAERGVSLGLTEAAVKDMVVRRHGCSLQQVYLQERHVCQAFQEAFFAKVPAPQRLEQLTRVLGVAPKAAAGETVKIQNEIRTHLLKAGKPAFVEETFINFPQAYRLILALGGIPCYPTLADGTKPICGYEDPPETLIQQIQAAGITMAEFITGRNDVTVLRRYVTAMRQAGLVVTAGTEHNTLDLIAIEPVCMQGVAIPDDLKELFWEGACVVAAHQFLVLHGRCGFVDCAGKPNPAYTNTEDRIAAFRQLGAAVIEKYYRM